jgi:hypothetical protein
MSPSSARQHDRHKHTAKLGTRTDSRNANSYRFESCLLKGQPGDLTAQSYQELSLLHPATKRWLKRLEYESYKRGICCTFWRSQVRTIP